MGDMEPPPEGQKSGTLRSKLCSVATEYERSAVPKLLSTSLQCRGFSLVELCVCVAVPAILMAMALPSLAQLKQRQRLELVAQTMMANLQEARSEAVSRADAVQLRFSRHAGGSCYILHTGASGQCQCEANGQAVCAANERVLKLEWIPSDQNIAVRANVANMSFQARQGAVTSTGSIDISSNNGETIRHVVSIAGRVRSCSPTGELHLFPRC
ncbi:GspH/FimT family pseudopilin [Paucibacter sp. B2R-40]|uniref:GspH/FimT family pseudopilin n=1 Tax=Paucibacter sp. B2R-40 TaxID=2893554 RepID=UPI0021E4F27B|nr:GspH/FimT family pseudopilin [Paucibacter sp. B2R-40]MCV2355582.1 GspH/FimT family pseudopilin [Paucibacter sp. B2R-40]